MKSAGTAARSNPQAAGQTKRARVPGLLQHAAAKPLLFVVCLLPFCWLFYAAWADSLGANPAEALIRSLGDWTLRFLCLTLAVTPLRQLTGWVTLARFRRMLGLFTYFYVWLHFLAYGWLDKGLDLSDILRDIAKRPFILVGTLGLLLLTPLALTSFNRVIRFLGARRWQWLHRLIYPIALLGLLHFFWMRAGKNDFSEVAVYAGVIGVLFAWRIGRAAKARRKSHVAA